MTSLAPTRKITPRRLFRWALWTAILLGAPLIVHRATIGSSDFRGFHRIWRANLSGAMLPVRDNEGPVKDDPDPYPPVTYAIFAPLGALPLWAAGLVWYAISLASLWGIWRSTVRLLDWPAELQPRLWWLGAGMLPYVINNLTRGQNAPTLIWLCLAALLLAERSRKFAAGMLIGLAAAIKIVPAVFLLPYLLRREVKVLAGFAVAVVILLGGVATAFFGAQTNMEFHRQWWAAATCSATPSNPHVPDTMRASTRANNQALEAVLARLLMHVPAERGKHPLYVNLADVPPATWRTARSAGLGLLLLMAGGVLIALSRTAGPVTSGPLAGLSPGIAAAALMCVWLLLVSPIVWSHYYLWLFFPLACVLRGRAVRPVPVVAAWYLFTLLLASGMAKGVGVHYWATLALWSWCTLPIMASLFAGKRVGEAPAALVPAAAVMEPNGSRRAA